MAALPDGPLDERELLRLVASAERGSEHPYAEAIVREAERRELNLDRPHDLQAVVGRGVVARVGDHELTIGNAELLSERGVTLDALEATAAEAAARAQTPLFVAVDGAGGGHRRGRRPHSRDDAAGGGGAAAHGRGDRDADRRPAGHRRGDRRRGRHRPGRRRGAAGGQGAHRGGAPGGGPRGGDGGRRHQRRPRAGRRRRRHGHRHRHRRGDGDGAGDADASRPGPASPPPSRSAARRCARCTRTSAGRSATTWR